jgi:hypothetical protein
MKITDKKSWRDVIKVSPAIRRRQLDKLGRDEV